MVTEQLTTIRPEPCHQHPDERSAFIRETSKEMDDGSEMHLKEYRCANDDCGAPLGWEFSVPTRNILLSGPGECRDQRVRRAIDCGRYSYRTYRLAVLVALLLLVPFVISVHLLAYVIPSLPLLFAAGLFLAGVVLALMHAFIYMRKRRGPACPDFTEQPTVGPMAIS